MIRTSLATSAAVVICISLAYSCSSPTASVDAPIDADAPIDVAVDAPIDVAADTLTDGVAQDAGDATGDSGSASLDWYPGNYGLTDSTNKTAVEAFLTGALSTAFDGVELIYPWTMCESATGGDYSACFAAIDADLAATPVGKHIILLLQYKAFSNGGDGGDGGGGANAVPAYLLSGPGQWCVAGTPPICGQYTTSDSAIAMVWNAAVAAHLQAWFTALGAYYGPGGLGAAQADKIAGIALPETATGGNPGTSVGYTSASYISAIKDNLLALTKAFPTKPVFQYINFLPSGVPTESAALQSIGAWALTLQQHHVGLGCPDVGGNSTFHPPGYDTLMNATYQGHLPFNVAIEPMDYTSAYTNGLAETYAEATDAAPIGMAAQFVVWWYAQGGGNVFTIDDVAAFLPSHHNPNVALPY